MNAARTQQRAKEEPRRDQDNSTQVGSLPPRPGVVRDNSQSCAPVDADAVAIPGPEIGTEDAMEAFWRERPTLSTSDVDKLRKELRREAASDRRRRYCEQGDSSEEEGLGKTEYCTGCGSFRCQRNAIKCREQGKIERLSFLLETLLPDQQDNHAKVRKEAEVFLVSLVHLLKDMNVNVCERDLEKVEVRRRVEERRRGRADEVTSGRFWKLVGDGIEKERSDPGSYILSNAKDQRQVDYTYAQILQASTNIGPVLQRQMKIQKAAISEGRRYRKDSAAESMSQVVAHTNLKKAVVLACSQNTEIRRGARKACEAFMRRCPSSELAPSLKYGQGVLSMFLSAGQATGAGEVVQISSSQRVTIRRSLGEELLESNINVDFSVTIKRRGWL